MSLPFDKDKWILDAIWQRYIIPQRDGTILRRKSASADGKRMSAEVSLVTYRTHKKSGRVYFNMTWKGITKSVLVNRVIALCFLPNPNNLPQVNHIDGEKQHNWVDDPKTGRKTNLEWASNGDNEKHAHRTGLKSGRGSSNSNAKVTPDQVLAIRASQAPIAEIMKETGLARSTIANIRAKKTWSHI
ncbi:hypothetical protein [Mesorhizobium sp.]|uniref:hypothetical protein n=1 Tax=Mesorhizobium sp. TaxID=1871066 RepID=UPI000FE4B2F1|nr:hypothetical protein [Mesorhizobium sp.]RWI35498.1 MAG: hypothetical protein EOR14_28765 [Mesorhizobium sp.]RWJ66333.1 MAG: hypothetical protein EOR34_28370 [Mesorhizobium sp.]